MQETFKTYFIYTLIFVVLAANILTFGDYIAFWSYLGVVMSFVAFMTMKRETKLAKKLAQLF